MMLMTANPCEDVHEFAKRMIVEAYITNGVVLGEFNQHTFEVRPGSMIEDVIRPYDEWAQRSYFGEIKFQRATP